MRRRLSLTAIAVTLVACGATPDAPPDALTMTTDSSGSVPVITVAGEATQWTLESLTVIRPEPGVGFSKVRSIALDPRGGVWVADVGEGRLSHWSDAGEWIEDRGRVGSGPGEFRSPYSVAAHDDGLFVLDLGNSRIVRFDLTTPGDSSWLIPSRVSGDPTTVRLMPGAGGPRWFDFTRDGGLAQWYVRVDDFTDRLRQPEWPQGPSDAKECPTPDGSIHIFGSPFSPRPRMTPWRGGYAATEGGDYRIVLHDRAGRPVRELIRDAARDSVTDAEFRAETAEWDTFRETHQTLTCQGEIVRYRLKPAIRALLPDPDGRLWVELLRAGVFHYEIWSGDTLLGSVAAPARLENLPPSMLGDRLAVVAESPDGGHEVRLYRVAPPPPSR